MRFVYLTLQFPKERIATEDLKRLHCLLFIRTYVDLEDCFIYGEKLLTLVLKAALSLYSNYSQC